MILAVTFVHGQLQHQFAESRLCACQRTGEISRQLEKHPQTAGGRHDTDDGSSKAEAFKQAVIKDKAAVLIDGRNRRFAIEAGADAKMWISCL